MINHNFQQTNFPTTVNPVNLNNLQTNFRTTVNPVNPSNLQTNTLTTVNPVNYNNQQTNIPTSVNPVINHYNQNDLNTVIQQQITQMLPTIIAQVVTSTNAMLTGSTLNVAPTRDRGHRNSRRRRHYHRRHHESSSSDDSSDEDVTNLVTEDGTPLPPAHAATVRLIRSGKFVDLFRLLPRAQVPDSCTNMAMRASVDRQGVINLTRRHSQAAKIVDFNSWALAWSLFVLYYAHFHGRLQQLMGYFNRAAELASRYPWSQFRQYDIMFRTRWRPTIITQQSLGIGLTKI